MKEYQKGDILRKHESKINKGYSLQKVKDHISIAKQNMTKDFMEKKALIIKKLAELKNQNRSIEEIYKYTNEIILEEEDEEGVTERAAYQRSKSQISNKIDQ